MKKLLSVVLAVLMVMSLATYAVSAAITPTDGWYRSYVGDVLAITSAEDFIAFLSTAQDFAGKTVVLANDITLNTGDAASWESAAPENSIPEKGSFRGVFDGQGHTISGFYGNNIFATLGGTVKNLKVVNSYLSGDGAAIVGQVNAQSTIKNCYFDLVVRGTSSNCAGIVGQMVADLTIENVWLDGDVVSTGAYSSGFVGNQESNDLVITDSYNTANVTANGQHTAGFSAAVYAGTLTMTNCVNAGTIINKSGDVTTPAGALTFTVGSSSAPGTLTTTKCYVLKGSALPDTLFTRSASVVNGGTTGNDTGVVANVASVYEAADLGTVAADLGSKWSVSDGKLVLDIPADSDVIIIKDWAGLTAWAADTSDNAGKTVVLAADITAPADATWTAKSTFAGTFEGNGKTISGLNGAQGLIAKMTAGEIKNLSIDATISSTAGAVAIFVGKMEGDIKLTNCYAGGSVTSTTNNVAAFIGDGTKQ